MHFFSLFKGNSFVLAVGFFSEISDIHLKILILNKNNI